jgi:hypothetical protein
MNRFTILFLYLISIVSCKQVDNPKIQFLKWANKGAITDNIKCKADPNQNYCLYLPANYDASKNYPTIYAYDPHGKGHIPVALMKNIAERLGYIVIGSNNSKNGLRSEEINQIINTLFSDSQQKIAIDSKRIYLVGFSGGARVACMIAQGSTGIKGVIACSAGFQPNRNSLGFRFIGIAGNQDMNYLEMRQLNSFMDSVKIPNQLITFKGKHQWPNESTISEAITMLEIYAMQDSYTPINKNIIEDYLRMNQSRIQNLINNNNSDSLGLAYSIAKRTYKTLNGAINIESLKTTIDDLSQNSLLKQYLKEKTSTELFEIKKQQEYASAFETKSETWWKKEIMILNEPSSDFKRDVSKRLLGYISLRCYSYVNAAMRYQDWKAASVLTSIYIQVDPEIPESWYALACLQANTGRPSEAIESLRKAFKFGFSDLSKIQTDPLLKNIHGLAEFIELVKR